MIYSLVDCGIIIPNTIQSKVFAEIIAAIDAYNLWFVYLVKLLFFMLRLIPQTKKLNELSGSTVFVNSWNIYPFI